MNSSIAAHRGNPIQIIQGGLYGSEAKGAVAGHLVVRDKIDIAVRTGATNAGHTVYKDGQRFVMQQLPVGWIRPETHLVIGAGALIDPDILRREIDDILARTGEDIRERLYIDPRAYIHWPQNATRSKESGRHELIGATGKGCSEALISRLRLRGVENFTIGRHVDRLNLGGVNMFDTEKYLNDAWDDGAKIQLEGTQGQLLDLYLGPYPYTTHKQTGAAQWMSECGLSPAIPTEIVMVVRACPIRVAGNSGPLPRELSWPTLARRINRLREVDGLPPIIDLHAVAAFEHAVIVCAKEFDLPANSNGLDQYAWSDSQRLTYREALSHLHSRALAELDDDTRAKLGALFEMTTVTKKLRRIADLDLPTLHTSARQIRPAWVALTFLNYVVPSMWGMTGDDSLNRAEINFIDGVSQACESPVMLVNRGPLPEHFVEV